MWFQPHLSDPATRHWSISFKLTWVMLWHAHGRKKFLLCSRKTPVLKKIQCVLIVKTGWKKCSKQFKTTVSCHILSFNSYFLGDLLMLPIIGTRLLRALEGNPSSRPSSPMLPSWSLDGAFGTTTAIGMKCPRIEWVIPSFIDSFIWFISCLSFLGRLPKVAMGFGRLV